MPPRSTQVATGRHRPFPRSGGTYGTVKFARRPTEPNHEKSRTYLAQNAKSTSGIRVCRPRCSPYSTGAKRAVKCRRYCGSCTIRNPEMARRRSDSSAMTSPT